MNNTKRSFSLYCYLFGHNDEFNVFDLQERIRIPACQRCGSWNKRFAMPLDDRDVQAEYARLCLFGVPVYGSINILPPDLALIFSIDEVRRASIVMGEQLVEALAEFTKNMRSFADTVADLKLTIPESEDDSDAQSPRQ